MYSQFFLISLNEKGSFFKPIMFEYPEEPTSYQDIESKVMFGEAFLICAFYEKSDGIKKFVLPSDNFNDYPTGKSIMDYNQENKIIELSGKLDKIYIFLRGGFIIPNQNTFNKFILNSLKLREENINLIINPDQHKRSKGELFYDNDDNKTIEQKMYIKVDLLFDSNDLFIYTNKNNIDKYNYNDHILGNIEIWRANELFKIKTDNNSSILFKGTLFFNNEDKKHENIEGIYEKENNKLIFHISKDNIKISIFEVSKISFHDN
jgi:alpha-glucosidase (family GH31 glycosyl hydrolase)